MLKVVNKKHDISNVEQLVDNSRHHGYHEVPNMAAYDLAGSDYSSAEKVESDTSSKPKAINGQNGGLKVEENEEMDCSTTDCEQKKDGGDDVSPEMEIVEEKKKDDVSLLFSKTDSYMN